MSRAKLKRYSEIWERDNVLEPGKDKYEKIKGKWNTYFFDRSQPITLELACGRGEYTVGLARKCPQRNFVGVDIKGDRIWKGSGIALDESLNNVGFLRTDILLLEKFFETDEVDEIWITFPDPRPKDRDEKRRLTNNRFLDIYKSIINKKGWIRLKTDNSDLFDYTLDVLNNRKDIIDLEYTFDLYKSELKDEGHGIQTKYEKKHHELGESIKYLKFRFN